MIVRFKDVDCEDCRIPNFVNVNEEEFECGSCGCIQDIENDDELENE